MFIVRKQKGVVSIEFSIGFIFFWIMCAFWVEVSFLSYVSSLGDLAISETVRQSKTLKDSDNFSDQFKSLLERDGSLWAPLIKRENIALSVQYLSSIDDLLNDDACLVLEGGVRICGVPELSPIAVYRFTYRYKPLFNYFFDSKTLFNREMIAIQEYQRDKFKIE
ncbi:pilus assembly protein [Vibrio cincinnatiensis]|uniref:pilus assembly protein n=1 Tax=Vibrio cincinnatiensis TaxID=675 RepID=UPI001EDD143D|nr:pilus assembly protein [Vibrio cincinnatiensis]MCG3733108.1 pilus assembly protein [Vibrio cincinnatiensis]MCG3739898.1 pilus assembly protein [Vibrio cincinnatiensis]